MQEYYIRNADSDESRGPFTVEQLSSLAETGNITLESLVYDPATESWEVLEHHEGLRPQVFPERKRLTFREKPDFESINSGEHELAPITVDSLLAAAEGVTEETRHKKKGTVWKEKAAIWAMYISAISFVLSAIGSFWIRREVLSAFDMMAIATSPLIVLGIVDLCLALILFLQSAAVYPFVRFRAVAGAGFCLFFFWAVGYPLIGVAAAVGCAGIYALTIVLKMAPFIICGLLALLGMAAYAVLALGT